MTLDPGGFLAWVIVGVLAGWLTGKVMRGSGYGCLTDLVIGLLGSVVGGFVFGRLLGFDGRVGFWGTLLVATLGAIGLVALVRLLSGGRSAV